MKNILSLHSKINYVVNGPFILNKPRVPYSLYIIIFISAFVISKTSVAIKCLGGEPDIARIFIPIFIIRTILFAFEYHKPQLDIRQKELAMNMACSLLRPIEGRLKDVIVEAS